MYYNNIQTKTVNYKISSCDYL